MITHCSKEGGSAARSSRQARDAAGAPGGRRRTGAGSGPSGGPGCCRRPGASLRLLAREREVSQLQGTAIARGRAARRTDVKQDGPAALRRRADGRPDVDLEAVLGVFLLKVVLRRPPALAFVAVQAVRSLRKGWCRRVSCGLLSAAAVELNGSTSRRTHLRADAAPALERLALGPVPKVVGKSLSSTPALRHGLSVRQAEVPLAERPARLGVGQERALD